MGHRKVSEMTWLQKSKEGMQFFVLIFGACWGIYTFIYKDIIVPASRPPAVTLVATLDELDRADGMIVVRAHLLVANRGDAKVWVPALWWQVYGVSFSEEDHTAPQFANHALPLLGRGDESVSRFSSISRFEVVAAGRVPDYEVWYQPKDETVHEQLFRVPEEQFDALQILVHAYITKGITTFAPTRWAITDDGELMPTLMIKQTGWFARSFTGWSKDHTSRAMPFEPDANPTHKKLDRDDLAHNVTTASLRIKSKASTVTATEQMMRRGVGHRELVR